MKTQSLSRLGYAPSKLFRAEGGFTFIEILVSIAILAILMAIVTVSFRGANANGRDVRRQADLEIVRGAIERYRVAEGQYPGNVGSVDSSSNGNFLEELQTEGYLDKDYLDPLYGRSEEHFYVYEKKNLDGCSYILMAQLENDAKARACPSACAESNDANDYCLTD